MINNRSSNISAPDKWQLTKKELKKCAVVQVSSAGGRRNDDALPKEARRMKKDGIPILEEALEYTIFLRPKNDENDEALSSQYRYLDKLSIQRELRLAMLTEGSIQFTRSKSFGDFMKLLICSFDKNDLSVTVGILDLRGIYQDRDVVFLSYRNNDCNAVAVANDLDCYATYQSPSSQLLKNIVNLVARTYVSIPRWNIPIRWGNNNSLPKFESITNQLYKEWIGNDGGLSSYLYSAMLAYLVKNKANVGTMRTTRADNNNNSNGRIDVSFITKRIMQQQTQPSPNSNARKTPQFIDVIDLATKLATEKIHMKRDKKSDTFAKDTSMVTMLVNRCLEGLAFNLVFRKLKLSDYTNTNNHFSSSMKKVSAQKTKVITTAPLSSEMVPVFHQAIEKLLLYNVTLREINFSGTNLNGLGDIMGKSLAMNAQPLLSRINLSGCSLSDADLRGLLPGFARIWCGGCTLMESLRLADNPLITSASTWDLFFRTFVDPKSFPFWPTSKPPPPPNLNFLQDLDLRNTQAIGGGGLSDFIQQLSGLKSLKLTSSASSNSISGLGGTGINDLGVFTSLSSSQLSFLEDFEGHGMDDTCITRGLFAHAKTLRTVILHGYRGDITPLLCHWPIPVPFLSLTIKGGEGGINDNFASALSSTKSGEGGGQSPGSLTIYNTNNTRSQTDDLVFNVLKALSIQAIGLKKLIIHDIEYYRLSSVAPILATCGLQTLHVHAPSSSSLPNNGRKQPYQNRMHDKAQFWSVMATSKTLVELQLPNQIHSSGNGGGGDEITMIGQFLKNNRSVQRLGFDSSNCILTVDNIKALRSAFYGNKKVTEMQYPKMAERATMVQVRKETDAQLNEVGQCKATIKTIFKQHYSKYNYNWRERPNQLKLPYVERIRVAKRKIGKMERDSSKIGKQLQEISTCVVKNKQEKTRAQNEKEAVKLVRRKNQLNGLAQKKQKALTTIITKLHKAKLASRRDKNQAGTSKTAKQQISRSSYYASRNNWPNYPESRHNNKKNIHSQYRYWNDPYNCRFHNYYGYYGPHYYHYRHHYLYHDDYNDFEPMEPDPEPEPIHGEPIEVIDGDIEVTDGDEIITGDEIDDEVMDSEAALTDVFAEVSSDPVDPWSDIDRLTENADVSILDRLPEIHDEASELGPDVLAEISPAMDSVASVDMKLDEIAAGDADLSRDMLGGVVDSTLDTMYEPVALMSTLEVIPDELETFAEAEADDLVEMYAGAGPRDLDDGGPFFGGFGNAALSGAQRRQRARETNRISRRVRDNLRRNYRHRFYKYFKVSTASAEEKQNDDSNLKYSWPDDNNLHMTWLKETQYQQIKSMSNSNLFPLPETVKKSPKILYQWILPPKTASTIEVTLVTQCSLDRLTNLENQLSAWKGKASVAVYVKPEKSSIEAEKLIISCIENARNRIIKGKQQQSAEKDGINAAEFDVAVTMIEGCGSYYETNEPYPINYLRNVALLGARHQHLRFHQSLDKSAVLLIDVDFIPSHNLHKILHSSKYASQSIFYDRKVVVCAAFESFLSASTCLPSSIPDLKRCVDNAEVEGFHISHFPQGHSPTCFDSFFKNSLEIAKDNDSEECWKRIYNIEYNDYFEPYVVMASKDVPFYDERFQGYGLNKVSHLQTVAALAKGKKNNTAASTFVVLPGVFLIAPLHERSESWEQRYGGGKKSSSDNDNITKKFNQLWLKGLYHNFKEKNLLEPMVSEQTKVQHDLQENLILFNRQQQEKKQQQGEIALMEKSINTIKKVTCK